MVFALGATSRKFVTLVHYIGYLPICRFGNENGTQSSGTVYLKVLRVRLLLALPLFA